MNVPFSEKLVVAYFRKERGNFRKILFGAPKTEVLEETLPPPQKEGKYYWIHCSTYLFRLLQKGMLLPNLKKIGKKINNVRAQAHIYKKIYHGNAHNVF